MSRCQKSVASALRDVALPSESIAELRNRMIVVEKGMEESKLADRSPKGTRVDDACLCSVLMQQSSEKRGEQADSARELTGDGRGERA